jgi:DNA replication initiation complex subunit (GINS family)
MRGKMQAATEVQKEINITYETLFELLRREKNRDDLQELQHSFFKEVIEYLGEKQRVFDQSSHKEDLFSATEREKTATQLANIKKIVRELYERREKKIINMALNKSRTGSSIIDTSKLLGVEKKFFSTVVAALNNYREGILLNVLNLKEPLISEPEPAKEEGESGKEAQKEGEKPTKMVRFLNPIPKFVGKELEVYGPFEEDDMASLPTEIAKLLIEKGRAEEIKES